MLTVGLAFYSNGLAISLQILNPFWLLASLLFGLGSAGLYWLNYRELNQFLCLNEWHFSQDASDNAKKHLASVQKSMQVMCFGFGKYAQTLETTARQEENDHFESVARRVAADNSKVQLLTMDPFSPNMAAFTAAVTASDKESQARERRKRMVKDLQNISKLNDSLALGTIQIRCYAGTTTPQTSFRYFMADDDRIHVSVYQSQYRHQDANEQINEIVLVRPKVSAAQAQLDRSLFSGFKRLFEYQWEIARPIEFRQLHVELRTSLLTPAEIERARNCIDDYCLAIFGKTFASKLQSGKVIAAAIAGKDSMAAIAQKIQNDSIELVVPIIVVVPTESGQEQTRLKTLGALRRGLQEHNIDRLTPALVLHDDAGIWRKVNQSFADYSDTIIPAPCVGCHLYLHMIRCMLAQSIGIKRVISGDREKHEHGAKIKLNQTPPVLDQLIEEAKSRHQVDLEFPLREVSSDGEVWGHLFKVSVAQPEVNDTTCLFSGKGTVQNGSPQIESAHEYLVSTVIPHYKDAVHGIQAAISTPQ